MNSKFPFFILLLLLVSFTAKAQIVYHDENPDAMIGYNTSVVHESFYIDMDIDGPYEFNIETTHWGPPCNSSRCTITPVVSNQFVTSQLLCDNTGAFALNAGDMIGPDPINWGYYPVLNNYPGCNDPNTGYWVGVSDKYVGVRFSINGFWHYGWINLTQVGYTVTITGWAYNAQPDCAVIAGDLIYSGITQVSSTGSSPLVFSFGSAIHVQLPPAISSGKLRLYNACGQLVLQQELENNKTTITCGAEPGIYFAELYCDEKMFAQKLLLTDH